MTTQELLNSGKLELYVLGELSEADAREVETASAGNPEVNEEIRTLQNALRKYIMCFEKTPPLGFKREVLEELLRQGKEKQAEENARKEASEKFEAIKKEAEEKTRTSKVLLPIFIITSVLSLLSAAFFAYRMHNANNSIELLSSDNSLVKEASLKEKEVLLNEIVAVRGTLEQALLSVEVLKDSNYKKINMHTLDGATKVPLYWNKSSGELFIDAALLQPITDDQTYQLWTINEGIPEHSGTVVPQLKYLQKMKNVSVAEEFTLTIEQKGETTDPSFENKYAAVALD
jgi:anti-sigma-K factor RskA